MSESLAANLTRTAAEHGDKVAFKLDDVELPYAVLDEGSARIAGLLRAKGLEPGDRVGMMLPNVPYFPVIYYGILRAGGVVVPMNVLLKGREVHFYLEDSGAKVAVRLARLRRGRAGWRRRGGHGCGAGHAGRVRAAAGRGRAGTRGRRPRRR